MCKRILAEKFYQIAILVNNSKYFKWNMAEIDKTTLSGHNNYLTKVDGHAERILERMNDYMNNLQLCDVVLISGVDGTRISAHRLVLSAASDYFTAMFTGSMREMKESEVILKEVDGNILQNLIQHCYTGSVNLSDSTVEALLITASLLQFDILVELCIQYLTNQLQPENCLGIALLAEQHSLEPLLKKAKSFAINHFIEVSKNEEFLQLNLQQLSELLISNSLNASLEEDVLKSLTAWLQHDIATRDEVAMELFNLVRLPLLDPDFIDEYLAQPCDSTKFQKLVKQALTWQVLQPIDQSLLNSYDCVELRKSTIFGRRLLVCGNIDDSSTVAFESYCPRFNKWTALQQITLPVVEGFGVVVLNDQLLIVGGGNIYSDETDEMFAFDLKEIASNNKFENPTSLKPMNTKRFGHSVAVLDGYVYAVGGRNSLQILDTAERWDPISNAWSNMNSMWTHRMNAGICVFDGCLYVIGGLNDDTVLGIVERFDPATNEWTFKKEMNRCRQKLDVLAASGYLYAIGGEDDEYCTTIERYDPSLDTWTLISSLTTTRKLLGCAAIGDRVFAIGDRSFLKEDSKKKDPNTSMCLQICRQRNEYNYSRVVVVEDIIPKRPPQKNFVFNYCKKS